MKANCIENLIADQLFKISKGDKDIFDFLDDCDPNTQKHKTWKEKIY